MYLNKWTHSYIKTLINQRAIFSHQVKTNNDRIYMISRRSHHNDIIEVHEEGFERNIVLLGNFSKNNFFIWWNILYNDCSY